MQTKNTMRFTLTVVAVILGAVLFKQFNFEHFRFKNNGLAVIYLAVFVTSVYLLVRTGKKSE